MEFEAEVKSGGFRIKTLKDGPPIVIREVKLLIDSSAKCLDEISAMSNKVVRVKLDTIQSEIPFTDKPNKLESVSVELPFRAPPKTTKRIRRKSELRH